MNEFIVWDKSDKRFYPLYSYSVGNKLIKPLVKIKGKDFKILNEECQIFNYINKKDINNKKIYADCSIVEFILKDEAIFADFTGRKPTIWNEIKMIGYFTFNDEDLRYEIDIIDWEKSKTKSQFSCLYYNFDRMSDFKIIDTIQVNKLGLIK